MSSIDHQSHLVLHFDVNETIIIEDIAAGLTREECINRIISKCIYVDVTEEGPETKCPTHFIDGTKIESENEGQHGYHHEIEKMPLHLRFEKSISHPNSRPYSDFWRIHSKNFTSHSHGIRFKSLYDKIHDAMCFPSSIIKEDVPSTLSKDNGITQFILPAFFETIYQLEMMRKKYSVVIRTFGTDLEDVAQAISTFARGEHPMYPDFLNTDLIFSKNKLFKGRYNRETNEFQLFRFNNNSDDKFYDNGEPLTNMEIEVLDMIENNKILGIQDDYFYWRDNLYSPQYGKPVWITAGDKFHHIFFDDNIHNKPDDSIVAIRKRSISYQNNNINVTDDDITTVSAFKPISGQETIEMHHIFTVKVHTISACLEKDYFLKQIELCELNKNKQCL